MNPQYMPYGGPQQGAGGFQNVPLAPGPPRGLDNNSVLRGMQSPNPLPPNVGSIHPPSSQLPPSQLPPSLNGPPSQMFGMQNGVDVTQPGAPKAMPMPPLPHHNFNANMPPIPPPSSGHADKQNANLPPASQMPPGHNTNNNVLPNFNTTASSQLPPSMQQNTNLPPVPGLPPLARPPVESNAMPPSSNTFEHQTNPLNKVDPLLSGQHMAPQSVPNVPPASTANMPPHSASNPSPLVPPMNNMPPLPGQKIPSATSQQNIQQMRQPSIPGQPPMPPQPQGPQMNAGQTQGPPSMHNQPPMPGQPPLPGRHPISGGPMQNMMPGQPPMANQNMPTHGMHPPMGQPMPPQNPGMLQKRPPMPGQPPMPMQPPMPGQPPMSGQPSMPGQPLMPGQPPMPGQMGGYNNFNRSLPPMSGQPQAQGPYNQLPNQMQNMNLSGPYPPKSMNGDGGPHMPPQMSAQPGYINGQQQQPRPGYPGMPGQGMPNQYPQSPYGQQQPQQQKRLNPDQMPSPIQVIQDDRANRSGTFYANQKGLVPPLASTNFVVEDQGYASPRYIRSTMYNVPITNELMKQTAVPFGLVISPMARHGKGEYPPPVVNFGELGPVRCIRCKAYMCPYMQFIDSGRRFQCLFCKASTDVPAEYFQHLDHTGQRMDRFERPELVLGTYEFTATKDYCRNNTFPKPPAIIFVIDVSYNNVKSGLVALICSQMQDIIKNLPIDEGHTKSNMRVGFITYNSTVHFYNIKGNLAAPQMLVVGDTQEMFMPLLDGFLCTPEESEGVIDALMTQIPQMFADTRECETILLPAIVAGMEALKASECPGKLLVFHSSLPIAEAPGKLKVRDDRKLLGTEKERTVLTPQNQTYNQLGQEAVGVGCSVDLFLFNNAYIDIATIGQVARLSGGEIYKYTYFQADLDGQRVIHDIVTNISRPIGFDAIMRVRTSTGVRPTDFYGHCFMSNTTDIELASIDCDKALAIEVKHDDKLQEDEGIYIQVALLYTSVSGQRRLRIINQALKTCSQMADLYRSCDFETIINFFSKQAVYKILDNNPKAVKDGIIQRSSQMLATYRKHCASPSNAGQLILPECMKLLPLYVNCLLKSDALSGGADMTIDDRTYVMMAVMTMDIPASINYFYPRLIPLHEITINNNEPVEVPMHIRCTFEKMTDQGVYILENGIHMFLWIGLGANQDFVQQVFGVPSAVQFNIEQTALPELDNSLSEAVRLVVEQIRSERHRYMRLTFVRQKEKMESVFKHFLVEDRGLDGSPSYIDFLCHMHKEIRNILS